MSQSESYTAGAKLDDIRALDAIAAAAANAIHQYRPRTCYPHRACVLEGQTTIAKRINSFGSNHVRRLRARHRDPDLKCLRSTQVSRTRLATSYEQMRATWFHQEFMPGFEDVGEFRVYIVARPAPGGLRGLAGRVVRTAKTTVQADGAIRCADVTRSDLRACRPLTITHLRTFALYYYDELRKREDWEGRFESLEVGIRLDITVSPGPSTYRFFVNEPTRILVADYFPGTWSGDSINEPVAAAMHRYLQ